MQVSLRAASGKDSLFSPKATGGRIKPVTPVRNIGSHEPTRPEADFLDLRFVDDKVADLHPGDAIAVELSEKPRGVLKELWLGRKLEPAKVIVKVANFNPGTYSPVDLDISLTNLDGAPLGTVSIEKIKRPPQDEREKRYAQSELRERVQILEGLPSARVPFEEGDRLEIFLNDIPACEIFVGKRRLSEVQHHGGHPQPASVQHFSIYYGTNTKV